MEIDVAPSGPIIDEPDGWFNVFVVGYKALIIDYRLLCCFLFLEHSAEIPNVDKLPEVPENEDVVNCMTPIGIILGCMQGSFLVVCVLPPLFSVDYISLKAFTLEHSSKYSP